MNENQILVLALANVSTSITVLIGILVTNARLSDLNSRFTRMEIQFESRLARLERKFDARFDLLLSKVIDLDNRLTRIEAQRH